MALEVGKREGVGPNQKQPKAKTNNVRQGNKKKTDGVLEKQYGRGRRSKCLKKRSDNTPVSFTNNSNNMTTCVEHRKDNKLQEKEALTLVPNTASR